MKYSITFLGLTLVALLSPCQAQNSIGSCDLFEDGPNDTWPRVITSTTPDDPSSGGADFGAERNFSALGGANYRCQDCCQRKLVSRQCNTASTWSKYGDCEGVDFDRSVKFQFSSTEIEFDALQVNGETLTCANDLEGTAMSIVQELTMVRIPLALRCYRRLMMRAVRKHKQWKFW